MVFDRIMPTAGQSAVVKGTFLTRVFPSLLFAAALMYAFAAQAVVIDSFEDLQGPQTSVVGEVVLDSQPAGGAAGGFRDIATSATGASGGSVTAGVVAGGGGGGGGGSGNGLQVSQTPGVTGSTTISFDGVEDTGGGGLGLDDLDLTCDPVDDACALIIDVGQIGGDVDIEIEVISADESGDIAGVSSLTQDGTTGENTFLIDDFIGDAVFGDADFTNIDEITLEITSTTAPGDGEAAEGDGKRYSLSSLRIFSRGRPRPPSKPLRMIPGRHHRPGRAKCQSP